MLKNSKSSLLSYIEEVGLALKKPVWRIRDVYPGSWFLPIPDPASRIPDLGSRIQKQQQKRGMKKICCHNFLCSHKFHKLHIILVLMCWRKKRGQFSKNYRTFYPKIVNKLSKLWIWDLGSEIRDPEKTYSGSRIQGSKRHRIPDPDPQHWIKHRNAPVRHRERS